MLDDTAVPVRDGNGSLGPPHIVFVVADDLGTFDVPFTKSGSEIITPTLSRLASEGLVLDNYYVQPLCTPSRAAFMTGRHPVQLGLQHGVIRDSVPDGVPLNETMLPEILRQAGYRTFHVGKWHLGFVQPQYTPERRGFDSSFGYYTGNCEYWNHTSPCWGCGNYTAVDLHFANATHWIGNVGARDVYSTELFAARAVQIIEEAGDRSSHGRGAPIFLYLAFEAAHGASSCYVGGGEPPDCMHPDDDELHVPERHERAQAHIVHRNRRRYAGIVSALDEAVANVSAALERSGLAPTTLVLFTTDNGAPYKHLGGLTMSNFPLRGGKAEVWEGGVRGACFLHGAVLPAAAKGQRTNALVSAADWFPTLIALAGASAYVDSELARALYGVDMSALLVEPRPASRYKLRSELLINADHLTGRAALRSGDLKLVKGEPPSGWGPDPRSPSPGKPVVASGPDRSWWNAHAPSKTTPRYQLYNITRDPQEHNDLTADSRYTPDLDRLIARLGELERTQCVPVRSLRPDDAARPVPVEGLSVCTPSPLGPILCNTPIGVWQPWQPDGGSSPNAAILASSTLALVLTIAMAMSMVACYAWRRIVCQWHFVAAWMAALERRMMSRPIPTSEEARQVAISTSVGATTHPMAARLWAAVQGKRGAGRTAGITLLLVVIGAAALVLERRAGRAHAVWGSSISVSLDWSTDWLVETSAPYAVKTSRHNNIVLILTDDQDQMLGGGFDPDAPRDAPTPMPKTRSLLGFAGSTARNMFAHSPICCPSRAQLLTGRYLHNLLVDPSSPPEDPAEDCMHVDGRRVNNHSFAMVLQAAGFKTALFGKYLNQWPSKHYVPRGFDAFLGNGGGSYLGPRFIARGLEELMGIRDGNWRAPPSAYSTSIIGNATVQWLRHHARQGPAPPSGRSTRAPWFVMMAPKAAHEPFVPAPWYAETWDERWPRHEPRPHRAWNTTGSDKHGSLRSNPTFSTAAAAVVSGVYRNRWRTLLSVDDAVAAVVEACWYELESTFLIFTSDHGFTLGEFNMLMDKRHVYDFDTRVPFLVRGPGISAGSVLNAMATLVDLAPTILEMAGVVADGTAAAQAGSDSAVSMNAGEVRRIMGADMDGRSLLPLLTGDARGTGHQRDWRSAVLIEHRFWTTNIKCVSGCRFDNKSLSVPGTFPAVDVWCANLSHRTACWQTPSRKPGWAPEPYCDADCYATEDESNSFAAIRQADGKLYAEGWRQDASSPVWRELYASTDKWQTQNLLADAELGGPHREAVEADAKAMHEALHREWIGCRGERCY